MKLVCIWMTIIYWSLQSSFRKQLAITKYQNPCFFSLKQPKQNRPHEKELNFPGSATIEILLPPALWQWTAGSVWSLLLFYLSTESWFGECFPPNSQPHELVIPNFQPLPAICGGTHPQQNSQHELYEYYVSCILKDLVAFHSPLLVGW